MKRHWGSVLAAAAAVLATTVPAQAMSGGERVPQPAAAPWMATLAIKGTAPLPDRAGCGGVLVGPSRVLTAAHCLPGSGQDRIEVHIGASVLSEDPGRTRDIAAVISHPGYELLPSPVDPHNPARSSARNDIALLILDAPVTGVRYPGVAAHRPPAGTRITLYGHGITAEPGPSNPDPRGDVLRRGELEVIGHRDCAADTPAIVDAASTLCARDPRGRVTACVGDSGGPAVLRRHGRVEVVGIFSFAGETAGRRCGEPSFAAFADPSLLAR